MLSPGAGEKHRFPGNFENSCADSAHAICTRRVDRLNSAHVQAPFQKELGSTSTRLRPQLIPIPPFGFQELESGDGDRQREGLVPSMSKSGVRQRVMEGFSGFLGGLIAARTILVYIVGYTVFKHSAWWPGATMLALSSRLRGLGG